MAGGDAGGTAVIDDTAVEEIPVEEAGAPGGRAGAVIAARARDLAHWVQVRDTRDEHTQPWRWPVVVVLAIGWTVLRWAWLSDDAQITARVVENFLHGYGPNYNIDERVQAFTHPLWFFAWSGVSWATGEVVLTPLFMGVACAVVAALCVWRVAASPAAGFVALFALLVSDTFVTWSGSGLENPLAMMLIGLLWCMYRRRTTVGYVLSGLLVAALGLTRLDLLALILPVAVVLFVQAPGRRARAWFAGCAVTPILLYFVWARLYYGYALPATYYAKTNTAIPRRDLVFAGFRYTSFWVRINPEGAVLLAFGLVLLFRAKSAYARAWGAGVVLYIAYVIWIGGDFMEGRFFAVPLFVGALATARYFPEWRGVNLHPAVVAVACCAVLALLAGGNNPAVGDASRGPRWAMTNGQNGGIADERGEYVALGYGLSDWYYTQVENAQASPGSLELTRRNSRAAWKYKAPVHVDKREVQYQCGRIGNLGLGAGPGVHIVDRCGLADMFIAQIKYEPARWSWRVGHFIRDLPAGYIESVESGHNQVVDPTLHRLLDHVWSKIR